MSVNTLLLHSDTVCVSVDLKLACRKGWLFSLILLDCAQSMPQIYQQSMTAGAPQPNLFSLDFAY